MKKEEIQRLIDEGYHIIRRGVPAVVKGDLWEYLNNLDDDSGVLVPSDLLTWSDGELDRIKKA
ncbi:hypothetical protein [Sphingobacterium sp. BN32]|uniref:hypothetical protein n=1 Tax=Sphingobacterium sp. BN32 TaxID=3058432 RepID=UPI00265D5081|nr:hypothetical protein [Sphingobacterium sp. BN32]WKK58299.1 hypothetical protein QYC40_16840 [Sphingobacterium sp. BN32]